MPDHLKNAPNSKEFDKYLKNFMKRKMRLHRQKAVREIAGSIAFMISA